MSNENQGDNKERRGLAWEKKNGKVIGLESGSETPIEVAGRRT